MRIYQKIFDDQKRLLAEAKQVGVIYHFTSMQNAWGIIANNKMEPKGEGSFSFNGDAFVNDRGRDWVSFTRNPNLKITPNTGNTTHSGEVWNEVRIAFDGDKLSQHHKIKPFHDDDGSLDRRDNQAEEMIKGDVDVSGAVIGVVFYYDVYMRNQTDYGNWASEPSKEDQERYTKMAREEAAMFVREIKKLGIPVEIKRGKPVTRVRR